MSKYEDGYYRGLEVGAEERKKLRAALAELVEALSNDYLCIDSCKVLERAEAALEGNK